MSIFETFLEAWRTVFRLLAVLIRRLCEKLRRLLTKRGKSGRRDYRDVTCLTPPPIARARPDPFIYSQDWLTKRGFAVVWDNPDFRILDPATGTPVNNHDLKPDRDYVVEVTTHNGSYMAGFGTLVRVDVFDFGMGTGLVGSLGTVAVDLPGGGTAIAKIGWHTPSGGGHYCLKAFLSHPDDANPLNNVGQHNTDVAVPASPTRMLAFKVRNGGIAPKLVRLRTDAYRLPDLHRCPETHRERHGLEYLRRLQTANDPRKFPVPEFLAVRLSHSELELAPGQEVEVVLELNPPPSGRGTHSVNVHAYEGDVLLGGITAYVFEEGA